MKKLLLLSILVVSLLSCSKDDPAPVSTIVLQFDNQLRLHPDYEISYHVSTVKFEGTGLAYANTGTYLIDASTNTVTIDDIPPGNYDKVRFTINALEVVSEDFNYSTAGLTYTFTVDPLEASEANAPRVFVSFDVDKIKDDSANAFVVTKVTTK